MTKLRWALIALFLLITIIATFFDSGLMGEILPIASVLSLFIVVVLHGIVRYGPKNLFVFFMITWVVSHFFEALSIRTGFPFGNYYYDRLIGPRIFDVPLIIMLGYFSMGYVSWMLSNVLLQQYNHKLKKSQIFLIPLIGTFIMVMWDLCMDPLSSTIGSLWVWKDGGSYFGVPLQNFFGWFLVVYIIFQLFALYISRKDSANRGKIFVTKPFWMEMGALYGIQALSQLIAPWALPQHGAIYGPMALVTVFTMVFVTLLSGLTVMRLRRH